MVAVVISLYILGAVAVALITYELAVCGECSEWTAAVAIMTWPAFVFCFLLVYFLDKYAGAGYEIEPPKEPERRVCNNPLMSHPYAAGTEKFSHAYSGFDVARDDPHNGSRSFAGFKFVENPGFDDKQLEALTKEPGRKIETWS